MTKIPQKAKYVIIGAGIHGLSTAWNLGEKLKAKGQAVKENDIVEEGQPLCIVEAMKMENTLLASKKCMISKIHFAEGSTLSVEQTIMEFLFK